MSDQPRAEPAPRTHVFEAEAYVENLPLRRLVEAYPEARKSPLELRWASGEGGEVFLFPFGALVFREVRPEERQRQLSRLRQAQPRLSDPVAHEEITVQEGTGPLGVRDGVLHLDRLSPERSGIVALTLAQSASLEYYERLVQELVSRTNVLVERLEKTGTVPMRTKPPLHRFIGEAVGTRNEVLCPCTSSTSPTRPGTTRPWTRSTTTSRTSST